MTASVVAAFMSTRTKNHRNAAKSWNGAAWELSTQTAASMMDATIQRVGPMCCIASPTSRFTVVGTDSKEQGCMSTAVTAAQQPGARYLGPRQVAIGEEMTATLRSHQMGERRVAGESQKSLGETLKESQRPRTRVACRPLEPISESNSTF